MPRDAEVRRLAHEPFGPTAHDPTGTGGALSVRAHFSKTSRRDTSNAATPFCPGVRQTLAASLDLLWDTYLDVKIKTPVQDEGVAR